MSTLSHLLLVFTDLDGCLLDHFTYDYELARPALDQLKQSKVPLILSSSKTLAELAELSAELKLRTPFIVENGAGVVIPDGYFSTAVSGLVYHQGWWLKAFGPALSEILTTLHKIREENGFRFSGFSDMSSPEVADLTGLSLPRAEMAKQRLFTEPVMWQVKPTGRCFQGLYKNPDYAIYGAEDSFTSPAAAIKVARSTGCVNVISRKLE